MVELSQIMRIYKKKSLLKKICNCLIAVAFVCTCSLGSFANKSYADNSSIDNNSNDKDCPNGSYGVFPKCKIAWGQIKIKGTYNLHVTKKNWDMKKVKFKYRWYKSGKKIQNANKSKIKASSNDAGKYYKVKVTISKKGYPTKTKTFAKYIPLKWKKCRNGTMLCASKGKRMLYYLINSKIKYKVSARFGCITQGNATKNGTFKIYWKDANFTSTIYGSAMPYAMFFKGGQAVHYSSDFAARGYAGCSHGCINIRNKKVLKKIYKKVKIGTKIVVNKN